MKPRLRRIRTLVALAAHIPIIGLLAAAIVLVLKMPGETMRVAIGYGPQVLVPRLYTQIAILAVMLPLLALALARIGRAAAKLWRLRGQGRAAGPGLEAGEQVRWRGGPGWRSFGTRRILLTSLGALGPSLYVVWLSRIWTGSDPFAWRLFDTFMATTVLAGTIIGVLAAGLPTLRIWLFDAFGVIVVTDRRIAWLSPWRDEVYREIQGADLIFAGMVEGDGARGWVALTESRNGRVREFDLRGLPQPKLAVKALEALIHRAMN